MEEFVLEGKETKYFYSCPECSSPIEIVNINNYIIEYKCFNKNLDHGAKTGNKISIEDFIEVMRNQDIEQNEKCDKKKHNNNIYECYCFECHENLCQECLSSREHLNHDKISLKEILPRENERKMFENIIKELSKNKLENLKKLYELLIDSFDANKNNYYYAINLNHALIYYININPYFKANFSKEEIERIMGIEKFKNNNYLKVAKSILQENQKKLVDYEKEITELIQNIAKYKKEIDNLNKDIIDHKTHISILNQEYKEELEELNGQNNLLNKEIIKIKEENKKLSETINELKNKCNTIIFEGSKIINKSEDIIFIINYIQQNDKNFFFNKIKLLYRGSRDGDNTNICHLLCDNKKHVLIIMKSENGKIFGGYSKIGFKTKNFEDEYENIPDNNSFLFSIDLQKIYPVVKDENVICNRDYNIGLCFYNALSFYDNFIKKIHHNISPFINFKFQGLNEETKFEINANEIEFRYHDIEVYQLEKNYF